MSVSHLLLLLLIYYHYFYYFYLIDYHCIISTIWLLCVNRPTYLVTYLCALFKYECSHLQGLILALAHSAHSGMHEYRKVDRILNDVVNAITLKFVQ